MSKTKARLAGFFYILMLPLGALVPLMGGPLRTSNDPAQTAAILLAHPALVHTGYAVDVLVVASYLVVTALFYEMFAPVNGTVARVATFFGLTGCALQAGAAVFRVAPLLILQGDRHMEAPAFLVMKLYSPAYRVALVFFGFYGVLIGWLIFHSAFLPRIIGVLMALAGVAWITFLWAPLANFLWPAVQLSLAAAGEGSLMLWLLIKGTKAHTPQPIEHGAE
ncbi:MAG TPA: DUF4386 domain-containing protein [Thermoanaerobaculia bacterium]|nr:DUF4386 domain-containing protein [Thermoanaerobaculia bacterium]